jgi:hypothetical protein
LVILTHRAAFKHFALCRESGIAAA